MSEHDNDGLTRVQTKPSTTDPGEEPTRIAGHEPSVSASQAETMMNPEMAVKTQLSANAMVNEAGQPLVVTGEGYQILNRRFILEKLLGSGGMGEVYAAKDMRRVEMRDDDAYIAIKLLREEFRHQERFMVALQRESKRVQLLSHPNIVTVYDFDRDGDSAYISMEFLKGDSLDRRIFPNSFSVEEATRIIDRMARGLAYAHQEGYVHADFKPANVFLTEENQVKILDFGIAQAVIKDKQGYRNAAHMDAHDPNLYALTPNYASLEMLRGENPLPSDDVFSLCCVAYELFIGKHPFLDNDGNKITAEEAFNAGMTIERIDGIPKPMERAIRRGLSFERAQRFDNAGAFIDATKPLITRKQVFLITFFSLLSVFSYFAFDQWQATKVPMLSSLSESLAPSKSMILEADELFQAEDIDLAHRLYAQAWDVASDRKDDSFDLKNLRRIIDHRMNQIAEKLIEETKADDINEFRLQQILIALEFMKNDELGSMDKKIESVLAAHKKQQQQ